MPLVWSVDCKICALRFAVMRRRTGESVGSRPEVVGRVECPHCHEFSDYEGPDLIPTEGRVVASRLEE